MHSCPQIAGRCSWPAALRLPVKTKLHAVWSFCCPEMLIPTWWTGEGGVQMCFRWKCLWDFQHSTYCRIPIDVCQIITLQTWLEQGRKKQRCWIRFPLMVLVMFSCHVVALCSTVLHTVCVYLCVLFGMSCYGMCMYRRVSDRQTNKHTKCKGWPGEF